MNPSSRLNAASEQPVANHLHDEDRIDDTRHVRHDECCGKNNSAKIFSVIDIDLMDIDFVDMDFIDFVIMAPSDFAAEQRPAGRTSSTSAMMTNTTTVEASG